MTLENYSLDQLENLQSHLRGETGELVRAWLLDLRKQQIDNVFALSTGNAVDIQLREQAIGASLALSPDIFNSLLRQLADAIKTKRQNHQT